MSRKKLLTVLPLLGGALAGLLLDLYLQYSERSGLEWSVRLIKEAIAGAFLGLLAAGILWQVYRLLNRWLPWHENLGSRFFATFLSSVILVLGLVWGGYLLYHFSLSGGAITPRPITFTDQVLKLVILVVLSGFLYTIIEFAIYSYHQFALLQIEAVQQDQARLALQYDLLQTQLSPHYLFNGLNTISSLVHSDPELASRYIRNFAQTYQYLLRTSPRQLVSLREELDFVRTYVFLLQVRFGGNLKLEVTLPEPLLASVIPPLTLQLLIENAVKHNLVTEQSPLLIRIYSEHGDVISVTNTIAPKEEQPTSHRMGLRTITQRYGYFTRQPVQVETSEQFEVRLPVLHASAIILENPASTPLTPAEEFDPAKVEAPLLLVSS